MSNVFSGLLDLFRHDRRLWSAVGFICFALLVWLLTAPESETRRLRGYHDGVRASRQGMGAEEALVDLAKAYGNSIEQGEKERQDIYAMLHRTISNSRQHQARVTGILEVMTDKYEQLAYELDVLAKAIRKPDDQGFPEPPPPIPEEGGLERFQFPEPPDEPELVLERPLRVSVITPGDLVQVRLLGGVSAPVDGTPYPVIFEVVGPIVGTDGLELDVGGARVIAAAQGSEADGRVLYRLTQLAMSHPGGRRSLVEIDGWIIGEDGLRGMPGTLDDSFGRVLAATAAVSGAATLADRMDNRNRVIRRDENTALAFQAEDLDAAGASALTSSSLLLTQTMLERYKALVPTVYVNSGREVTAVFSKPAEIELLPSSDLLLARATE